MFVLIYQGWDSFNQSIYGIALVGKMMRRTVTFTSSKGEHKPYIKIETSEGSALNIGITGATGATGASITGERGSIGPTGIQGDRGETGASI